MKITKGKWKAYWTQRNNEGPPSGWYVFSNKLDKTIANIPDDPERDEADAKLIACAPKMQKMLKRVQKHLELAGFAYPQESRDLSTDIGKLLMEIEYREKY